MARELAFGRGCRGTAERDVDEILYSMELGLARLCAEARLCARTVVVCSTVFSSAFALPTVGDSPGPPVAPPGWSRWLVPPPPSRSTSPSARRTPSPCSSHPWSPRSASPARRARSPPARHRHAGLSAAFGGTLVERHGPRCWAMTVALVCFSSGFLLSALGAAVEQYWPDPSSATASSAGSASASATSRRSPR